jgi:glucan phosphoethanolaminetransferase (alkaline phosphatase superfamily)
MDRPNKNKNVFHWIFAAIIAIIIGTIGSGLWEFFFSDSVQHITRASVKTISLIFNSYRDNLHSQIGMGCKESTGSLFIVMIVVGTVCLLSVHIVIKAYKRSKLLSVFTAPILLVICLLYLHIFIRVSYTHKAVVYVERSIEILAPYINNQERLRLHGLYRSVDNAEKFYELYNTINEKAKNKSIKLTTFTPL